MPIAFPHFSADDGDETSDQRQLNRQLEDAGQDWPL